MPGTYAHYAFGKKVLAQVDDEIKNIKKRCRLTKEGITDYGLIQVLKKYHLEAKAYQCEFKHLFEEVNCPAIVHLKQDDLYHNFILY